MSYGRNSEQTEDYLPSSSFQFSSEALHSFSYAIHNPNRKTKLITFVLFDEITAQSNVHKKDC